MFRLFVVLATIACAIQCNSVHGEGRIGRWFRGVGRGSAVHPAGNHRHHGEPGGHQSYYPPSPFAASSPIAPAPLWGPSSGVGLSIGVGAYPGYGYPGIGYFDPYRFDGYGYDPYRYGSFNAPDLLNDPYFRERYRYDSRFPGRHRTR